MRRRDAVCENIRVGNDPDLEVERNFSFFNIRNKAGDAACKRVWLISISFSNVYVNALQEIPGRPVSAFPPDPSGRLQPIAKAL
jgi:hypothetical protein